MSINELTSKVHELRELSRMADELDTMIDALRDEIKNHMTATKTDEINGIDFKITYKPVTRSRFDVATFKRENPDTVARYTRTSTYRSFSVT